MKPLCIALTMMLLLASAARADEFQVGGGGAFFSGLHSFPNGTVVEGPLIETFNVGFIYNPLSHSVSDMSVTSQGLLGSDFVFTGVTDNGLQTFFEWSNDEAILIGECGDNVFPAAKSNPFAGSCDGTKTILLTCRNDACTDVFVDPVTGKEEPIGSAFDSFMDVTFLAPSPVPEPSSLTLLASGLLAAVFLLRRRKRHEIAPKDSIPSGRI